MVGLLPWSKHRRAPPSERLVRLKGVGLGVPELLFGPGALPDPLSDHRGLPRVCRPGQTLAAMLPWPLERVCVGVAGDARHMLIRPDHEGVIGCVHPGRGAVHVGQGEQLAREFGHEDHHGSVRGEPLGADLPRDGRPDLRHVAGGCGRPLKVYVRQGCISGAPATASCC